MLIHEPAWLPGLEQKCTQSIYCMVIFTLNTTMHHGELEDFIFHLDSWNIYTQEFNHDGPNSITSCRFWKATVTGSRMEKDGVHM